MTLLEKKIIEKESRYRITKPDVVTTGKLNRNDYILAAMPNIVFVDCSEILTKLIGLAGTYCKTYASDLFLFWNEFVRQFNASDWDSLKHTIFGFFENGVDCNKEVVDNTMLNPCYYRQVAAVDVNLSVQGEVVVSMQVF